MRPRRSRKAPRRVVSIPRRTPGAHVPGGAPGAARGPPRAVGRARALGITLLGDRITAEQAVDWGLIWCSVADDQLDEEVSRVSGILERSSPGTVTRIRQCVDAATDNSFAEQLAVEMAHQAVLIPRNMREGAKAFIEKRETVFSGQRDR